MSKSFTSVFLSSHEKRDLKSSQEKRQTSALLRKYEEAEVTGHRATEISRGFPILIPLLDGEDDAVIIAQKELKLGVLDGTIMRVHANGETEFWDLRELKLPVDPASK